MKLMGGRLILMLIVVAMWFASLGLTGARAQDATGRIIGNVTDQSGAPIADAKVTVRNLATGNVQETRTDKDGFYQVLSLPIGTYTATVEHDGFRKQVFERQALQISQSLRLDAKLEIGQQSETIEVKDQVTSIETVNQTIGSTVTGAAIQQAPLNGRNVLDLAKLQPGVTETNGDSGAAGTFSIAGGRTDSVTFLLDGGLNNDLLDNGVVFNPNPDTIAEFRILESNYSAEYGRNGGGVVSVVTKSGTNEFHGSAFEFLRNDAFNANSYLNKSEGNPRDVLKRNQYGGTVGGPIRKDKLFFFVGYQGQKLSSAQTSGDFTVYKPAQLTGDFSGGGTPGNCPNADAGVASFLQASPFFQANAALAACAIIDPTKIDAVAQKYIKAGLFPTAVSGDENFHASHTNNNNELTIKTDFVASQKDKLTVTLGGIRNPQLNPFLFATVPGFADISTTHSYFGNLAYYRTFTPNLVNELRLFVQRNNILQSKPATNLPTASDLGIGITPDQPTGPPNILFDNGLSLGFSEQGPTALIDNTFGFSDTLSWIRGRHNFKMGTGVSAYQNNTVFDFIVNGEFDFNGTASGNSLADFLLGAPSLFFQAPAAPSNIRSKSYYGFFQDEWRATKRLSINVGIRYEYNSPKLDTQGRSFSVVPGAQSTRFPKAPVGLLFPGDAGAPKGANFPDKNDWAPRVGFAWDPRGNGKTSIRGGFGVFYDVLKGEDNLQFNGQPPFFGGAGLTFTANSNPSGPYPFFTDPYGSADVPTPNPFPSHAPPSNIDFGAAGFLPINASGIVFLVDPHLRTPYTYQYNLSVQHEVAPNTVLEVSYVGSSSHGLTGLIDVNPFVLGTTDHILNLTPGNSTCPDEVALGLQDPSANIVNPTCSFAGLAEFKNLTKASYNSLQASLTKQMSNTRFLGRTYFTLAYTWAHSIDNVSGFRQRNSQVPTYSPNLFRASSDQDVRNRITFSGGWDLPFDRDWISGPKRLTQGWSLFPIVTWRSGLPFDIFARLSDRFNPGAEGPSGAGDPFDVHANIVGSTQLLDPRTLQTFINPNDPADKRTGHFLFNPFSFSNAQCLDPTFDNPNPPPCTPGPGMLPSNSQVVADPSLATYGGLPRNFLRGNGYVNFDLAVSKTTAITERLKLEFRAEFFNIFNHANFLNPNVVNNGDGTLAGGASGTNINSGSFGQISGTYDPRIIQFGLRLSF
jgi:hypothetical protein